MEKRGKKLLRALLYAVMVLVLAAGLMSAAQAEETCDITAETTAWNIDGAVYRATGNVTIQERVMVTGNITLDLGDDATLTCANGISVPANNSLTIQGTGTLIANASNTATATGIGGYSDGNHRSSGAITINGGTITATGGQYAAGIGSGMYGYCNPITINGGTITATGGDRGAGIGSGALYSKGWTPPDEESLEISKKVANDPKNHLFFLKGETIKFEITVTNKTSKDVKNVILTDALMGGSWKKTIGTRGGGLSKTYTDE